MLRVANWFAYALWYYSLLRLLPSSMQASAPASASAAQSASLLLLLLLLVRRGRRWRRVGSCVAQPPTRASSPSVCVWACAWEAASCKYFCIASTIRTHLEAMATPTESPLSPLAPSPTICWHRLCSSRSAGNFKHTHVASLLDLDDATTIQQQQPQHKKLGTKSAIVLQNRWQAELLPLLLATRNHPALLFYIVCPARLGQLFEPPVLY